MSEYFKKVETPVSIRTKASKYGDIVTALQTSEVGWYEIILAGKKPNTILQQLYKTIKDKKLELVLKTHKKGEVVYVEKLSTEKPAKKK